MILIQFKNQMKNTKGKIYNLVILKYYQKLRIYQILNKTNKPKYTRRLSKLKEQSTLKNILCLLNLLIKQRKASLK